MDFLTAQSEADGIVLEREKLLSKMADIIVKTMIERVNRNRKRMDQNDKELSNLLKGFSEAEKFEIMKKVFFKMC